MNEQTARPFEHTGARAKALLGGQVGGATGAESAGAGAGRPNEADASLIAARIRRYSSLSAPEAAAIARQLIDDARKAVENLVAGATQAQLTDHDVFALESVIYVRSRPAVRIIDNRLEGLDAHPGSELWQDFISDYEERIIAAATATGAAMLTAPTLGASNLLVGSAWLVTANRVVTNRHVLRSDRMNLLAAASGAASEKKRIADAYSLAIEFTFDNRKVKTTTRRRVTEVLYVSEPQDAIDIAVLGIEGMQGVPLTVAAASADTPRNLFVVGHPGLMDEVPSSVRAVFGNPDGKKRVSFGKSVSLGATSVRFGHDASTIGGYSGGPVVGITDGAVAGLHYYGDPANGNLAISAAAIRGHQAFGYCV